MKKDYLFPFKINSPEDNFRIWDRGVFRSGLTPPGVAEQEDSGRRNKTRYKDTPGLSVSANIPITHNLNER